MAESVRVRMSDQCRGITVAMLGARMGYAVPKILQHAGVLDKFYTDFYSGYGIGRLLRLIPEPMRTRQIRRVLSRDAGGVPAGKIVAFNSFGVEYVRRINEQGSKGRVETYLWGADEFSRLVDEVISWDTSAIFAFNTAALAFFNEADKHNVRKILEQTIAPYAVETSVRAAEQSRFPDWEPRLADSDAAKRYSEKERQELLSADLVICGSEYVRQCVGQLTNGVVRCSVVPYGVRHSEGQQEKKNALNGRPLRALFAGTLCLRKGIQYVAECAKQMAGSVEFSAVGPSILSESAMKEVGRHIKIVGSVPRSEMKLYWEWADVLILPSLCEGSATVTYEALSAGVPVICTNETGSVVKDGVDGFIVEARDVDCMVKRLEQLMSEKDLLSEMSAAALSRREQLSVESYAHRLMESISRDGL